MRKLISVTDVPWLTSSWVLVAKRTKTRHIVFEVHGPIDDEEIVKALVSVMRQDRFQSQGAASLDGRDAGAISDVLGRQPGV